MKRNKIFALSAVVFSTALAVGMISTTYEAKATDDTHQYSVKDYWGGEGTQGTSIPNSNVYNATSVSNLGGDGNADWGAVVGTWGASVSVAEGECAEIVYKIGVAEEVITSATFKGEFRFWNGNLDSLHNGDRIFIDASVDGNDYTRLEHVAHIGVGDGVTKSFNDGGAPLIFETSLDNYISGIGKQQFIFVKVTMMHYIAASAELGGWGMFIHESGVTYTTKDAVVINYDLDGGTMTGAEQCFYTTDGVYTLPTPTREGYEFLGWFNGDQSVTSFDPSQGVSISIKAKWQILQNSCTITYSNTMGANNTNPLTFDKTSTTVIQLESISVTGYTFDGWYDALEGGNRITSINPATQKTDIELFAHWTENQYSLTIQKDANTIVKLNDSENIPENIKYTEVFQLDISFLNDFELGKVEVNGQLVNEAGLSDGHILVVRGSDCEAKTVVITSVKSGTVATDSANLDFTTIKNGDSTWKGLVYSQSNLRSISDQRNSTGLSLIGDGVGVIILKFNSGEDVVYDDITIEGSARLFDFNNGAYVTTNLRISVSEDGEEYKLIKQYSANTLTDGEEMVNLAATKVFNEPMQQVFVKVELNGAPGMDWAVLKSLSIEFSTTSLLAVAKDDAKIEIGNYGKSVIASAKTAVDAIVAKAKTDITNATGVEQVNSIVAQAKADIDAAVLTAKRNDAKAEIEAYVEGWSEEMANMINPIINKAKTDIDAATADAQIAILVSTAKTDLDSAKATYEEMKRAEEEANKKDEKGCGGSVVAASLLVSSVAILGTALISKRKHEN